MRYDGAKGDFYAAGKITYFTIFALFPMLMLDLPPLNSIGQPSARDG